MTDRTNIIPISARQQQHLPAPLTLGERIARSEEKLTPPTAKEGNAQLAACLTLVAPSGMTAADRDEWLKVAAATLSGIPADLLARGAEKARRTCRFASEIVPAIMAEVEDHWRRRQSQHWALLSELDAQRAPKLPEPERASPEEVRAILAELKLGSEG